MKPIKLYTDLSFHLYEGEVTKKRGTPTPITYLTQWTLVGNSEVHNLPYPDGVVLPTGYKRCKYLQTNGNPYIEVPFGFDKTDKVYLKGAFTGAYKDKYMVSPKVWNDDTNRFGFGVISQNIGGTLIGYLGCSIGSTPNILKPLIEVSSDAFEFEYKDYICRVGNSSANYTTATFGSTTQNLRLFYGHNTPSACKIYEYRHKKANAEYRLIPCLDSSNVPCMYDVINNQAYYNSASSGSFDYELYPQPTEIWSCGEYSDVDNKYHIVVLPTGKQAVDIVLDKPLRKTDNTADTLEYPTETSGKALLTIRVEESGGELSPLDTPTTELVDAPQIEEADSYTCEISQGAKAVEWSSFETE